MLIMFRRTPLVALVAALLVASSIIGIVTAKLIERARPPLEVARALARTGRFREAERAYLVAASRRPISLPVLVELLDNHQRLALRAGRRIVIGGVPERDGEQTPEQDKEPDRGPEVRSAPDAPKPDPADDISGAEAADTSVSPSERAIVEAISAPDLAPKAAFLAQFWRRVVRGEATSDDRVHVSAVANADPPEAWANHLLGRAEAETGHDAEAAERFAREAESFDDRRDDADAACTEWISDDHWDRLGRALETPRFARQVRAPIRMQAAIMRRDWPQMARWFFPAQYEGVTPGIGLLAAISAFTWFAICAGFGRMTERPRVRVPLYLAAFVLGVLSTYLTLLFAIAEHMLGFTEKKQPLADAIYYVVGVGFREEISKALLLLPLMPVIRRVGTRREALACGALVGLGFAAEENLGYLHLGLSTALARFLTANFLHVSTTGLVAVALDDESRGARGEPGGLSQTLMIVIAAHGLYDFFLSSSLVEDSSYLSMFVFILLTRRFVAVLRMLPGRQRGLLRQFCVGLTLLAGASYVYACSLVGPMEAIVALAEGGLGLSIVTVLFVQELRTVSS